MHLDKVKVMQYLSMNLIYYKGLFHWCMTNIISPVNKGAVLCINNSDSNGIHPSLKQGCFHSLAENLILINLNALFLDHNKQIQT